MLKRTVLRACYTDHAARYNASRPRRPVAAFTGAVFPEHVTRALEGASRNAGYASPYWLTKANVRQHRVPLRPGQTGTAVCIDQTATKPTELYHAEHLDAADVAAFLAEFPMPGSDVHSIGMSPPPDAHPNQPHCPWVFRGERWRRVSHLAAVQAMRNFRNAHGLVSDIWVTVEAVAAASLKPVSGAHPIPVHEQPATVFYNAEQTTLPPERFAPPYAVPGHGRAASASAVAADPDAERERREVGAAAAQAMGAELSRISRRLQPKHPRRPDAASSDADGF